MFRPHHTPTEAGESADNRPAPSFASSLEPDAHLEIDNFAGHREPMPFRSESSPACRPPVPRHRLQGVDRPVAFQVRASLPTESGIPGCFKPPHSAPPLSTLQNRVKGLQWALHVRPRSCRLVDRPLWAADTHLLLPAHVIHKCVHGICRILRLGPRTP